MAVSCCYDNLFFYRANEEVKEEIEEERRRGGNGKAIASYSGIDIIFLLF